jgi:tetratricopeptide (TPR) repeat protein
MELEKAEAELREAVRLDPEFALAYYRLSIVVGNWGRSVPEARAPAERAAALKDRLSPTDRDIVQGNVLYQTGRLSDAIALFESALARDPGHKEGLYLLSLCYLQSPRDADPRRAIELMERLLAIDPEYHAIYTELALSYVLLGDFATAHARLDGWEAKEPEQVRTRRALLSAWEGRLDEALKWSEASEEASNVWWRSMYALAADRFDLARSLIEKHEQGAGNLNEGMRWVQPFLHASTGQFGPAEAAFRKSLPTQLESDDFASLQAVTLHALAELRMLKGDLKAAQREAERALMIQPEGPFCLYFAGLVASQAGDFRGAERHLATLQAVTKVARGPLVPYYRDALVAEVALARGHPEVARPLLENAVRSDKLLYEAWRGFFPRPLFCDGLARIYLASGEKPKAALALEALLASEWERIFHPAVYIRALYTLGMLKLDVGDRAVGRELLQKFLMHWGKADWDLKEVRDAQARLTIF